MKLWYNNVALHGLGEITIASQSTQCDPDQLAHKEVRTIVIRIDFFESTFEDNYALLQSVRSAFAYPNGTLKWQDEDVSEGVDGVIYLNQPVDVVSHDIPENPNAWGTYQQQISITCRYQVNLDDAGVHLQATFQNSTSVAATNLGSVTEVSSNYACSRYSEMHSLRRRSSGAINISGEFKANPADPIATRRAALAAKKLELDAQVNGKVGTLVIGSEGQFLNQAVRVDSWKCDIEPGALCCKWALSASYTIFPLESGYAGAEFSVQKSEDKESGEEFLTLSGSVIANTETAAYNKFAAIQSAVLLAKGFTSSQATKSELGYEVLNVDDSQGEAANSSFSAGNVFVKLNFSWTYRKRGSVLNYDLTVSDANDTRSGLIRRTYSGHVVASGATADDAYAAALAKAEELGSNKHDVRLSSTISRGERNLNSAGREFLRLEFSYEYQIKGARTYLEYTAETVSETFGETTERITGFVVAADKSTAEAAYQSIVADTYADQLIRGEALSNPYQVIDTGEYSGSTWTPDGSQATTWLRIDFSFSVLKEKGDGNWAIKYATSVEIDYVQLRRTTRVQGSFFGSPSEISDAESGAEENALDAFLSSLDLGVAISSSRSVDHEKANDLDISLRLDFASIYVAKADGPSAILQCEVTEEIQYTGTRWAFQPIPDGPDIPQSCGTQRGARIISGSIVAATEADAMTWVKKNNPTNETSIFYALPTGIGGGESPETRYAMPPRISRSFDFLPLTDGNARGASENAVFTKVTFTFEEALLSFPYNES